MDVSLTSDIHIAAQTSTNNNSDDLRIVKADQFCWSWNYEIRSVVIDSQEGRPAINRTGQIDNPSYWVRGKFTSPWQFFWADLLAMRVYGKLLKDLSGDSYKNIVDLFSDLSTNDRFLNNGKGTDNCDNYVEGKERGCVPVIDPLICAGSVVRIKEIRTSQSGKTNGMKMAMLDAFDNNSTPPPVTMYLLENDPRVQRAKDIQPSGNLTEFAQIENRFPWLDSYWCPYPFVARQECWFPLVGFESDMNVIHDFCTKRKLSRKLEDAFTSYCKAYIRETFYVNNGQTTTSLLFALNDDELEKLWQEFVLDLKHLLSSEKKVS